MRFLLHRSTAACLLKARPNCNYSDPEKRRSRAKSRFRSKRAHLKRSPARKTNLSTNWRGEGSAACFPLRKPNNIVYRCRLRTLRFATWLRWAHCGIPVRLWGLPFLGCGCAQFFQAFHIAPGVQIRSGKIFLTHPSANRLFFCGIGERAAMGHFWTLVLALFLLSMQCYGVPVTGTLVRRSIDFGP